MVQLDAIGFELSVELCNHSQKTRAEPFWLHRVLFATYFPAWRQYIAALEREFLPIANGVNVAYIDEQLRVGFENLSMTMSLQKKFLQISRDKCKDAFQEEW